MSKIQVEYVLEENLKDYETHHESWQKFDNNLWRIS